MVDVFEPGFVECKICATYGDVVLEFTDEVRCFLRGWEFDNCWARAWGWVYIFGDFSSRGGGGRVRAGGARVKG